MKEESREEKIERIHDEQAGRKWHQPGAEFRRWWEPDGFNQVTGAQTGGHECALRRCVHRETGERRDFGISAEVAFNTRSFRSEYQAWIKDGMPERAEKDEADGTSAHRDEAVAALRQVKAILSGSDLIKGVPALQLTDKGCSVDG